MSRFRSIILTTIFISFLLAVTSITIIGIGMHEQVSEPPKPYIVNAEDLTIKPLIVKHSFMTIEFNNTTIVEIPMEAVKSLSVKELQSIAAAATFLGYADEDLFMSLINKLVPNRFIKEASK